MAKYLVSNLFSRDSRRYLNGHPNRAMTRNEAIFPDPEKFRPERFLSQDGSLNDHNPSVVFGFGRRLGTIIHCLPPMLLGAELPVFFWLQNLPWSPYGGQLRLDCSCLCVTYLQLLQGHRRSRERDFCGTAVRKWGAKVSCTSRRSSQNIQQYY